MLDWGAKEGRKRRNTEISLSNTRKIVIVTISLTETMTIVLTKLEKFLCLLLASRKTILSTTSKRHKYIPKFHPKPIMGQLITTAKTYSRLMFILLLMECRILTISIWCFMQQESFQQTVVILWNITDSVLKIKIVMP